MEQQQPERRSEQRYAVDAEATVVMVNQGAKLRGRLIELSPEGCRLQAYGSCAVAAPTSIELMFKLNGIDFRLGGTMQWADTRRTAGIQFGPMAGRRRDFLMELLSELEAEETAKEQSEPAREAGLAEAAKSAIVSPAALPAPAVSSTCPERRTQKRHVVDSRARLFFVDVRAQIAGSIVDVSLGGCRIRTDERFPVGIYRRVETEFTIDGLPFRLGGVVQSIHDKFSVGIRFLDMSSRKREQLAELVAEMEGPEEAG